MFIFTFIRKLFFWILLAGVVFWFATKQVGGRKFYQVARESLQSEGFKQGMKDIGIFVGGMLKSLGEEIEEQVSADDQQKLDKMIEKKAKEKPKNGY